MAIRQDAPVFVVGALNLDICGAPDKPLRFGDSNPGSISLSTGGVGHNIARHLAAGGTRVELISILGDDDIAEVLARRCLREGIGLRHMFRMPGASCGYLCIHDTDGELTAAVNAMAALDVLLPSKLEELRAQLCAAPLVVVDANLPQQSLRWLTECVQAPLLLDPVSGFKAERARACIGGFAAIKPNALEAEALSGEKDMDRAADWFLARGVRRIFISMGERGLLYADRGDRGLLAAPSMRVNNSNGAGDAQAAGIALGMLEGGSTRQCAQKGMEMATAHLRRQGGILI